MSGDVKQAAERLREMRRKWDAGDKFAETSTYQPDPAAVPVHSKGVDLYRVAIAYLAEHDPETAKENATLLTADILQASGWFFSKLIGGYLHDGFDFHLTGPSDVQFAAWHVMAVSHEFGTIQTVGDLRKLLEALHIPAVVVIPKGGE